MFDMNKDFMRMALELAKKGLGFTSPNPVVGAVIVKNNKVMSKGWHKKAGEDHAEIIAIKSVKNKKMLIGADLYVTFEPCCHYGKTPPCTDVIINSGIKRVFIGMKDPFRSVEGKGVKQLVNAGLDVEILDKKDELAFEIRDINQPFLKFVKTGLPYLVMKSGMSLDGKIAIKGKSMFITCVRSRMDARQERSLCDAVIIGANTVKIDDPELKISPKFRSKKLFRVILDGKLSLNTTFKIFRCKNVVVITSKNADPDRRKKFENIGVEVACIGGKTLSVVSVLKFLAEKGIRSVFVEGGGKTNSFFYNESLRNKHLLDKMILYIAPVIIGEKKSISFTGNKNTQKILLNRSFIDLERKKIDSDVKYTAILNRY